MLEKLVSRTVIFGHAFLDGCKESTLDSTNVNGFPIISSDTSRTLMGYIGRMELKYALGRFCQLKRSRLASLPFRKGEKGSQCEGRYTMFILTWYCRS